MEKLTKEQLEKTLETVREFKQLIVEKGSKDETIAYLVQETELSEAECEKAFYFYNNIGLPTDLSALGN